MNIGTIGGSWAAPMAFAQPVARAERAAEVSRAVVGVQTVSSVERSVRSEQLAAERTPWVDKTEQTKLDKTAAQARDEQKAAREAQEKKREELAKLPPLKGLTLEEVRIMLGAMPVMSSYQQQDRAGAEMLDVVV